MNAPTTVVPIPVYSSWRSAARNTRRLARWIAVRRRLPRKEMPGSIPYGQEHSASSSVPAHEPGDCFHGEVRGDLTRGVPAHAVGHDEQLQRRIADEAVLIPLADRPGVTQAVGLDHRFSSFVRTSLVGALEGANTTFVVPRLRKRPCSQVVCKTPFEVTGRPELSLGTIREGGRAWSQASRLTSCVRESTPILSKMRVRCRFVVVGAMPSVEAITGLE